MQTGVPL